MGALGRIHEAARGDGTSDVAALNPFKRFEYWWFGYRDGRSGQSGTGHIGKRWTPAAKKRYVQGYEVGCNVRQTIRGKT